MKVEEVERLLTAFYEGTATECEEEKLKVYFRTGDVPGHLHADRRLFLALCEEDDKEVPDRLAGTLRRLIDERGEAERRSSSATRMKRDWRWIGGIAATVVLLVGIGYSICNYMQDMRTSSPQDTFSDPEEAYAVLQSTLIEISTNLSKGISQVNEVRKDIRRINTEARNESKK